MKQLASILCLMFLLNLGVLAQESQTIYSRHASSKVINEGTSVKITLQLENKVFRKKLRLIELLPMGMTVESIEAPGARIEPVDEKRITFEWANVPANSTTEVVYHLVAFREIGENIRINGALYDDVGMLFQSKETVLNKKGEVRLIPSH